MDTQAVGTSTQAPPATDAVLAAVGARAPVKDVSQVAQKKAPPPRDEAPQGEARDPRSLQYQVDGSSRQVVATIVDESNKMVIVQIPDAEVIRIAKAIDRMKGFLIDSKA